MERAAATNMNLVKLQSLFPSGIVVEFVSISSVQGELTPDELASLGPATPARKEEFLAGRVCARKALSRLGFTPGSIISKGSRAPLWPDGAVGSITHKDDLCLVAVGRKAEFKSLGIDLEHARGRDADLIGTVCTAVERSWLEKLPSSEHPFFANVFLCAKEAVFKAQYPLTGDEDLDFCEVEITLDLERSTFESQFLRDVGETFRAGDRLTGRILLASPLVAAGVYVNHKQ